MKTRTALASMAVLVGLPAILYAPFLFGGKVLYWGVYLLQFYPWRQLATEQIRAGHWPLWNPTLGAGAPLAANLQTAAFYPPNLLFLVMPVERAFGWELALHMALAGLSAYYLGRSLGLRPFGALVSGLTYGSGGFLVARWVFPSIVYAAAWLPLMLALTEKLLQRIIPKPQDPMSTTVPGSGIGTWMRDLTLLALVIGLQLLAGHAQTSFYSALIITAFAISRLTLHVSRLTPDASRLWGAARGLGATALAGLWGVALAAIQLVPTAELVAHSQRAGRLTDLTFAYELSFWPWRIISLLAPDFFGNPARNEYWGYGTYWEEAAYVGILPLLFAALAVVTWWRMRKEKRDGPLWAVPFFSLLCLFSLLLALGDHTPLYPLLFRYVPGFGLFQAPARLMLGYALGMAVLAGIGAEALRLGPRSQAVLRMAAVAGLGIAIGGVAARLALPVLRASSVESTIRLGLTLTLSAALLLLRQRRLPSGGWEALAIALIAAELLAFGWGLAPGTDPGVYHARVATAEFLQAQPPGRLFVAEPYARETYHDYVSQASFGSAEPSYLRDLRESLLPNLNAVHGLPGVGNYDPLTASPYRDLYDILRGEPGAPPALDEIQPVLNLFGARYLLTDDEPDLPLIYGDGPRIYANDQALPQAFVVHQARVIEDRQARLEALREPSFDPRSEVILSRPPAEMLPLGGTEIAEELPWLLSATPDRSTLIAELSEPGFLVLTDTYYPGWRATVDGAPAEILAANHAFRAVALDAGEHTVVFEYIPLSFRLGAWISLGASVLLVAIAASIGGPRRLRRVNVL